METTLKFKEFNFKNNPNNSLCKEDELFFNDLKKLLVSLYGYLTEDDGIFVPLSAPIRNNKYYTHVTDELVEQGICSHMIQVLPPGDYFKIENFGILINWT